MPQPIREGTAFCSSSSSKHTVPASMSAATWPQQQHAAGGGEHDGAVSTWVAPSVATPREAAQQPSVLSRTQHATRQQVARQLQAAQQVAPCAAVAGAAAAVEQDEPPMFLERVVLWWCGIPAGSAQHRELQTILHTYAGVRYPELCDSITHIMVRRRQRWLCTRPPQLCLCCGCCCWSAQQPPNHQHLTAPAPGAAATPPLLQVGEQASADELQAVRRFRDGCNKRLELVTPEWLRLCQQTQRLAAADARCRYQLDGLLRHAAQGAPAAAGAAGGGSRDGPPAAAAVAAAGGSGILAGVFSNSASRQGFPAGAAAAAVAAAGPGDAAGGQQQQQADDAWLPEYWKHQPAEGQRTFEGCHFTLVALQGSADHQTALDIIRCASAAATAACSVLLPDCSLDVDTAVLLPCC